MRQDEVDAVVVGGGPAGCAAALALVQQGYVVTVIERSSHQAARIGETLPPMSRQLLADLGVWDCFVRDEHLPSFGVASAWGRGDLDENDFIFNPHGHGWHLDRARFDGMLAAAAEEAGAEIHRGAHVVSCAQDQNGAWDLEIGSSVRLHRYRARFVIDASGRAASFARKHGVRRIAFDRLIGVAAFLSPQAAPSPDARTLVEAVEDGWWYSARLPSSQLVMAYMTDADLYATRCRNRASSWEELMQCAPHTQARTINHSFTTAPFVIAANSARLESPAGKDWLAVGDAAMALDPLSSQGICQAMESGCRAAGAMHEHWNGDKTALSRYAQYVNQRFASFLSARELHYGREQRWPHSVFWRRRQTGSPDFLASPTRTESWTREL